MISYTVLRDDIPEPVIEWSGRSKITPVGDLLTGQLFFHQLIDPVFIHHAIIEIEAAGGQAKSYPESPGPAISFQDQQGEEADAQPYGIEGIDHEEDMEGYPVMTEGLEPSRAICVEGVQENMY